MSKWTKISEEQPAPETPVLIALGNRITIASLEWEYPSWEDGRPGFLYWDYIDHPGDPIDWNDVAYWMPLPPLPGVGTVDQVYVEPPLF